MRISETNAMGEQIELADNECWRFVHWGLTCYRRQAAGCKSPGYMLKENAFGR